MEVEAEKSVKFGKVNGGGWVKLGLEKVGW